MTRGQWIEQLLILDDQATRCAFADWLEDQGNHADAGLQKAVAHAATVFVVCVDDLDRSRTPVYIAVFSTGAFARHALAEFCRTAWDIEGETLSLNDKQAIERFFEFWDTEYRFSIDEILLDGENANAC